MYRLTKSPGGSTMADLPQLRTNTTKRKLHAGECVFGVFVPIPSPRIVEFCALAGFDYVIIDAEHGPIDVEACEGMVRAAEAFDITPIVRVPENAEKTILRYLDVGAQGVMVPQVNTRDDAERAIRAVKYAPLGQRGLASARAAAYGQRMALPAYTRHANQETILLIQIENVVALKHLQDMLTLDAIDVFELGTADLSQSLGFPGETGHPEVKKVVDEIVKQILGAGRVVGDTLNDPSAVAAALERGFRKIDCSYVGVTIKALATLNEKMRAAAPASRGGG